MESTTKARKIGTSLGVIIPATAAQSLCITAGTRLTMITTRDEIIIKLKYPQKKAMREYLDEVIARGITEDLEV
jgi:antitoxin component of MazEF toxin-antitoxin module